MLRSYLSDYSDADIFLVEATIDLLATPANENGKAEKNVAFENNAPFTLCVSKINNALIYNVEDLDRVMLMYNLSEYSHNYSLTSGSLWN